jgi:hypothetical protein
MYLLDTDVLSASAPTKARQRQDWLEWQVSASNRLFLSAVTIAEIERGICSCMREGATTKAARLRLWVEAIEHLYGDRVLPFDLNVAHVAGAMLDNARGHGAGFADVVIAATAAVHGLTLLTGNERHFRSLGIAWLNPFVELPPL